MSAVASLRFAEPSVILYILAAQVGHSDSSYGRRKMFSDLDLDMLRRALLTVPVVINDELEYISDGCAFSSTFAAANRLGQLHLQCGLRLSSVCRFC
jgi:hypothetical protein